MDVSRTSIEPARVTRPFQLLAAWLAGLVLIDTLFLGAASQIKSPDWAAGTLVVAAIVNTPVFLLCLFLLLTKFRPEMQEDQYYSSYIEKRFSPETRKVEIVSSPVPVRRQVPSTPSWNKSPTIQRTVNDDWDADPDIFSDNLAVNDLIPQFQKIRDEIAGAGLRITSTFGSTSKDPSTPEKFVLSVGEGSSITRFKMIYGICLKYGLDGVAIAREDHDFGRIYVGAYSYDGDDNKFAPITNNLSKAILNEGLTWKKLETVLKGTS